jgi:hypothetical protein
LDLPSKYMVRVSNSESGHIGDVASAVLPAVGEVQHRSSERV